MIAAKSITSAPIAYIPMPGVTVASSAILMRATRMPSSITSFIDQGRIAWAPRSISPIHLGAGGRRTATRIVIMNRM